MSELDSPFINVADRIEGEQEPPLKPVMVNMDLYATTDGDSVQMADRPSPLRPGDLDRYYYPTSALGEMLCAATFDLEPEVDVPADLYTDLEVLLIGSESVAA